jgi:hypothetical protein
MLRMKPAGIKGSNPMPNELTRLSCCLSRAAPRSSPATQTSGRRIHDTVVFDTGPWLTICFSKKQRSVRGETGTSGKAPGGRPSSEPYPPLRRRAW